MSDDLKLLKEHIYNNHHIEKLLDELGCTDVKYEQRGDLITASHDGWNKRAVQVKNNPSLSSSIRNRGIDGDIYFVVGFMLYQCETFDEVKSNLFQIKTYICNVLEYNDFLNKPYEKPQPKVDYNWWLRPIQQQRSKEIEVVENRTVDPMMLNQFVQYPWYGWYQDGMSCKTQREFGICFAVDEERVVIPIHNKVGQLIGAKGRYVGDDKQIEEDKKYRYIIQCSKRIELFNYFRALPYIHQSKQVVVVEGAKTTMLLWEWGIKNAVSIEGDRIDPIQVKLLKETGIDVEFIWAWDKDKDKDFIMKQTKQVKGRKMYYLYDTKDRFSGTDSPCDKGRDVFMDLYLNDRHRIT